MITAISFTDIDEINKKDVDAFKQDILDLIKSRYIGENPDQIMSIKNIEKLEFNFRDKLIVIGH